MQMAGILSVVSVVAGAAGAHCAQWGQSRTEVLEACGGILLIFGLGLLGSVLPHIA
jgi:hypothetical protein